MGKSNTPTYVWVLFFILGSIGSCVTCTTCFFAVPQIAKHNELKETKIIANNNAVQQMPWLQAVRNNCVSYESAPNEIKKSDVFRSHEEQLKKTKITDVEGVLNKLRTSQGGSDLQLDIKVGDVRFVTSIFEKVKRGTKAYNQVSEMSENQCVVFSANNIRPSSMTEKSKVCDEEYFVQFTDVGPCK